MLAGRAHANLCQRQRRNPPVGGRDYKVAAWNAIYRERTECGQSVYAAESAARRLVERV